MSFLDAANQRLAKRARHTRGPLRAGARMGRQGLHSPFTPATDSAESGGPLPEETEAPRGFIPLAAGTPPAGIPTLPDHRLPRVDDLHAPCPATAGTSTCPSGTALPVDGLNSPDRPAGVTPSEPTCASAQRTNGYARLPRTAQPRSSTPSGDCFRSDSMNCTSEEAA